MDVGQVYKGGGDQKKRKEKKKLGLSSMCVRYPINQRCIFSLGKRKKKKIWQIGLEREKPLAWGVKLVALIHLTKWRTCLFLPPFARYILNPVSLPILLIERLIIECLCQPAFCLLASLSLSLSNCVKTLHGDCGVARQPPTPPPH